MLTYLHGLKPRARKLRTEMTLAERHLWERLRRKQLGMPFYRQKPLSQFIVDFYCPIAHLVIELDGMQHNAPNAQIYDAGRTAALNHMGLRVLRFTNNEVLANRDEVLAHIKIAMKVSR